MLPRPTLLVLPALLFGCSSASSDDQTHGIVVDAAGDMAMDDLPDGSPDGPLDGRAEAGFADTGHLDTGDAGGIDTGHDTGGDPKSRDGSTADTSPPTDGATCKGTLALAGGTSSTAFGATSVNGGVWKVTSLTSSVTANPAIVAFGGGFLALFTEAGTNIIDYSAYDFSAWSMAESATGTSCVGPATALGAPSLTSIGSTLHSVYRGTGSPNNFYHGTFTSAAGWDCESDSLGGASYGPSAPAVASTSSSLLTVFDGTDHGLYVESWTSGVWGAASGIHGAGVGTTPPTLLSLASSSELLLVYSDQNDNVLYWATNTAGTWSAPTPTSASATSTSPVSMAPTADGGAVLVFEGTDSNPYFMSFDATASAWSAPAPIVTGNEALSAPPTVAAGICGADAVAEIVQPAGIEIFTLASGTWTLATTVSAAASMSYATIASSP